MNIYLTYAIIALVLIILEIVYFYFARKNNITDLPNNRSSHSKTVLRGGGIIFVLGTWVWSFFWGVYYPFFLLGLTLAAGVSFIDDIHSLPDKIRLIVHCLAAFLMLCQIESLNGICLKEYGAIVCCLLCILALVLIVGATNVFNFMDGINGMTAMYSLSVLIPLAIISDQTDLSLIVVSIISVLIFSFFNLRPKGKAKCFSGDVGSIGIAFILLFLIGKTINTKCDITYFIFLIVYGVDGVLTICHRVILHEKLGEAHRKHVYQLMCNELNIGHIKVSFLYMMIQLFISLGFIFVCPNTIIAHWLYLLIVFLFLSLGYVLFKKKYYHLHEEYLSHLKSK